MLPLSFVATGLLCGNPSSPALWVHVEETVTVMVEIYRRSFVVRHDMDQFQARGLGS